MAKLYYYVPSHFVAGMGEGVGGGGGGGGGVKISLRDRLKHGVEINVMEWQR